MSDLNNLEAILKTANVAPALPEPTGPVVRVSTAEEIIEAVENAQADTTILIADGHYYMPRDMEMKQHGVTIRSESGNRNAVILDGEKGDLMGKEKRPSAILRIKYSERVTVADITVKNSMKYGILFYADGGIHDLKIYNVVFHNIWARGLKGTCPSRPNDNGDAEQFPREKALKMRPRNGQMKYCLFIADHKKSFLEDQFNGDYISGTDMMGIVDWVISDNVFVNIRGANGAGRACMFIWQHCERVLVENNIIVGCDRGVSFGNPSSHNRVDFHMDSGVIRGNQIFTGENKAIECNYTKNVVVSNNRVTNRNADFATIEFASSLGGNVLRNNLVEGTLNLDDDVESINNPCAERETFFADVEKANFGLTAKGADQFSTVSA